MHMCVPIRLAFHAFLSSVFTIACLQLHFQHAAEKASTNEASNQAEVYICQLH